MKNELFCCECGRKLKYYTDENTIFLAWRISVSSYILTYELNKQNPNLPHRIMRKDLRGFWYCNKERIKHKVPIRFFDIKRYRNPIVVKTNDFVG